MSQKKGHGRLPCPFFFVQVGKLCHARAFEALSRPTRLRAVENNGTYCPL